MAPDRKPDLRNGFMLIEALIALAIVAVMAAMVYDVVVTYGRTSAVAGTRRQATLLARSVLASASVSSPFPPVPATGIDNGLAWKVTSEPYQSGGDGGLPLRTITVSITQNGSSGVLVRLASLKPAA
jgi:prepilin-type N-terminal cleavage/methylation domain-containing protein